MMGSPHSLAISNIKVAIFLERQFPDAASRPCHKTIINHIQQGLLSGGKIGGLWFVQCTEWGQPLHWHNARPASNDAPIKAATGNTLADRIIKQHFG
jgi:hypothetical protein